MSILTKLGGVFKRSPALGVKMDDEQLTTPQDVRTDPPDQRPSLLGGNMALDVLDAKSSAVMDRNLLRIVAKVMFVTSYGNATPEEMSAAWIDGKKVALDNARQLIRRLEKKGVSLARETSTTS
jgi:hypothetical protein